MADEDHKSVDLPLGQATAYVDVYQPDLLRRIVRAQARSTLLDALAFRGVDRWTAYELTWLNPRGRPECGVLELEIPCSSSFFIESKSLKLYLNSFSQSMFDSVRAVERVVLEDVGQMCDAQLQVRIVSPSAYAARPVSHRLGRSLDVNDIAAQHYRVEPSLLEVESDTTVRETLFSDLLRMRCPVTDQPDLATVVIEYVGRAIAHVGLLRYLISFRQEASFHEHAVERIFADILSRCAPSELRVQGLFCRRGGIAISPDRTTGGIDTSPTHIARQ